jgi:hypothetical protein
VQAIEYRRGARLNPSRILEKKLESMDCKQCGHEMEAGAAQCTFCGAPHFHKPLLAWPPVEPAKWAALALAIYGIFHLSFYM